jgi:hypothetical protein
MNTRTLAVEELEARIAPDAIGNPGNNNPGENNTNLSGNQPKDGDGTGSGDTSDNNNPGENNTNLPGNQPTD